MRRSSGGSGSSRNTLLSGEAPGNTERINVHGAGHRAIGSELAGVSDDKVIAIVLATVMEGHGRAIDLALGVVLAAFRSA